MKIVKVPVNDQTKAAYLTNYGEWKKIIDSSERMTAKEFWDDWFEEFDSSGSARFWFIIEGEPESIVDELVRLKMGESDVCYPWIVKHSPEDLIESRISYEDLIGHADKMDLFINKLCNYI